MGSYERIRKRNNCCKKEMKKNMRVSESERGEN